jgi:hypothetical protein
MREKELQPVTFEQAKRLKNLGFDWRCIAGYNNDGKKVYCKRDAYYAQTIYANDMTVDFNTNSAGGLTPDYFTVSVPSVALALKWFRDEKKIRNAVNFFDAFDATLPRYAGVYQVPRIMDSGKRVLSPYTVYYTFPQKDYESAGSALLDELLTILEKETRK